MFHYLLTVLLFVSCRILIGNLIARICIAVMLILMEKSRTRFVCNGVESLCLVESFLLSFTLPFCVLLLVQFKIHHTFQAREKKALQKVARHWEESQCWCSLSLSCVTVSVCAHASSNDDMNCFAITVIPNYSQSALSGGLNSKFYSWSGIQVSTHSLPFANLVMGMLPQLCSWLQSMPPIPWWPPLLRPHTRVFYLDAFWLWFFIPIGSKC